MKRTCVMVFPLLFLFLSSCGEKRDDEENLPERFLDLTLEYSADRVPVYYSAGRKEASLKYYRMLMDGIDYFNKTYDTDSKPTLVILNRTDWESVSRLPYHVPFAYTKAPFTVIMPAEAGIEKLDYNHELIVFHELGHIIAAELDIRFTEDWINELVASYLAFDYLYQAGYGEMIARLEAEWQEYLEKNIIYEKDFSADDILNMEYGETYELTIALKLLNIYRIHEKDFIYNLAERAQKKDTDVFMNSDFLTEIYPDFFSWDFLYSM